VALQEWQRVSGHCSRERGSLGIQVNPAPDEPGENPVSNTSYRWGSQDLVLRGVVFTLPTGIEPLDGLMSTCMRRVLE
jgi:hypothetical protein